VRDRQTDIIIIIIIILFFIKKLTNATYDKIYKLQSLYSRIDKLEHSLKYM